MFPVTWRLSPCQLRRDTAHITRHLAPRETRALLLFVIETPNPIPPLPTQSSWRTRVTALAATHAHERGSESRCTLQRSYLPCDLKNDELASERDCETRRALRPDDLLCLPDCLGEPVSRAAKRDADQIGAEMFPQNFFLLLLVMVWGGNSPATSTWQDCKLPTPHHGSTYCCLRLGYEFKNIFLKLKYRVSHFLLLTYISAITY